MHASSPNLVKVSFAGEHLRDSGLGTESVWAEPLGDDRYRIRNTPFYAYGFSFLDVVHAQSGSEEEPFPIVTKAIVRSGHSTYRLRVEHGIQANEEFRQAWAPLQAAGCTFEASDDRLLAVDVPPQTDIFYVYRLFEKGESAGVWDFEEAHCAHDVSKSGPAA
jgi:Domain of unknown function (DUF4265)